MLFNFFQCHFFFLVSLVFVKCFRFFIVFYFTHFFFSVPHMFYVFFYFYSTFVSISDVFLFFLFCEMLQIFYLLVFYFCFARRHFSIFMSDVNVLEKGDCWKKQLIFNKLLQVSCLHEIQRLYAYLSLGSLKVVLLTQKFRNFSMNFIVMLWTSQP